MGFPEGADEQLRKWNVMDAKLEALGTLLLRLDASFHASVAATNGRYQVVEAGEGGAAIVPENGTAEGGSGSRVVKDVDEALALAGVDRSEVVRGMDERMAMMASG